MKKRNTGINLFKLFSMFMIALLHVLGMGGITGAAAGTSSYYPVYLMQNAAFCAVNCYALVSVSYARQKDKAVEDNRIVV